MQLSASRLSNIHYRLLRKKYHRLFCIYQFCIYPVLVWLFLYDSSAWLPIYVYLPIDRLFCTFICPSATTGIFLGVLVIICLQPFHLVSCPQNVNQYCFFSVHFSMQPQVQAFILDAFEISLCNLLPVVKPHFTCSSPDHRLICSFSILHRKYFPILSIRALWLNLKRWSRKMRQSLGKSSSWGPP